jgi:hypothetical protein
MDGDTWTILDIGFASVQRYPSEGVQFSAWHMSSVSQTQKASGIAFCAYHKWSDLQRR